MVKDFSLLNRILRRNRNQRVGAGLVAGIAGLVGFLAMPLAEDQLPHSAALLSAGMALWGLGFAGLEILRCRSGKEDLMQVLDHRPNSIVWVYYYKVESMPYGIKIGHWTTLYCMLEDRDKMALRCTEKECQMLMDALRERLPHATFGYSDAKSQWYAADPNLLRR